MSRARVIGHPHEKRSPLNPTIGCPMLDRYGEPCGKASVVWCATPICEDHAIAVWRAVAGLIHGEHDQ